MKATGIVRRLDDLGRLVIPKEIRKQYHLKEGDSIEFFVENDRIILEKYNTLTTKENDILKICETLEEIYKTKVYFVHHSILGQEEKMNPKFIEKCHVYRITSFKDEVIMDEQVESGLIYPIVIDGYWQGSFVVLSKGQTDFQKVEAFCQFLALKYQL
ncbi:MAG: AbrB/MazE/SpoVT family DNA-binding domain-containing protein [Traorella sp.]